MKNPTDVFSGLVLLGACALGAYSVSSIPLHTGKELISSADVPILALVGMACCALIVLFRGLRHKALTLSNSNPAAVKKVLSYFGIFVLYLWGMIVIGDVMSAQDWVSLPHNSGFTIATFLFLLVSLPILGRRNKKEIASVAIITTVLLLVAFGIFFQVLLP